MPLVKKDGLPEIAQQLVADCRKHFICQYDEKDSIGKRYRRQDAIGTPFCVTIDHQTKEDGMVTVRDRDTLQQHRISLSEVVSFVKSAIES
jgi:glycyl-tRNA synthetase